VWALIPWLNAGANLVLDTKSKSAIWEQSRALVLFNYAALSLAVVITLWGTKRVADRLEGLRAASARVLRDDAVTTEPLRDQQDALGWLVPVLLTGSPTLLVS
jgi:hypothetical protein